MFVMRRQATVFMKALCSLLEQSQAMANLTFVSFLRDKWISVVSSLQMLHQMVKLFSTDWLPNGNNYVRDMIAGEGSEDFMPWNLLKVTLLLSRDKMHGKRQPLWFKHCRASCFCLFCFSDYCPRMQKLHEIFCATSFESLFHVVKASEWICTAMCMERVVLLIECV